MRGWGERNLLIIVFLNLAVTHPQNPHFSWVFCVFQCLVQSRTRPVSSAELYISSVTFQCLLYIFAPIKYDIQKSRKCSFLRPFSRFLTLKPLTFALFNVQSINDGLGETWLSLAVRMVALRLV